MKMNNQNIDETLEDFEPRGLYQKFNDFVGNMGTFALANALPITLGVIIQQYAELVPDEMQKYNFPVGFSTCTVVYLCGMVNWINHNIDLEIQEKKEHQYQKEQALKEYQQ
jgi:hypothetical protein|tara:strand:+ start:200 stop:532 length:333 start_codon:yes stop_codon:yes gene_type:complete